MKLDIVILGAGPAGLGAAFQLTRRGQVTVTVLERNAVVGGNAGSFDLACQHVDYGSHRLHPACDAEVMRDIRALLGDDLLDRPRHGRIRLRGRWIHFPLKPVDLALRLPPSFAAGVLTDSLRKLLPRASTNLTAETFASILEAGLGRTICRDFYFPYARKIWGLEPEQMSVAQARRRVSAGSLGKMARKVLSAVPGFKPPGSGRFFYPRLGFGQISEAYAQATQISGATLQFNATVNSVEIGTEGLLTIAYEHSGEQLSVRTNMVWSTIPITALARLLKPAPPAALLTAASSLDYRAMILIYLVVEQDQFTEYDAHYFPESHLPLTRLSEPKNYSASREPAGKTVLCAELPCSPVGHEWAMSDEELGKLVCDSLAEAGIPVRAPVLQVVTRRLPQAYPIYPQGYEQHFDLLDDWLNRQPGLLTFGRQGLFAHDNTHHALFMAYAAADCFRSPREFDYNRWHEYRQIFKTHVVED
ncbi:MAG: FAD-dependent oxidoreductase [Acidobacteriota bacterium]|nr:FAD-dependent oxidoreductase [Acidobacteriota bacterium]